MLSSRRPPNSSDFFQLFSIGTIVEEDIDEKELIEKYKVSGISSMYEGKSKGAVY